MTIALVCPDGLSILLFCKGIIAALQQIPGARVIVVCDTGEYGEEIEALDVTSISVPSSRFATPLADLRYCVSLYRVFARESCDVVFNFSTKPNIYGAFAARAAGVPRVVSHVVGMGAAFLPPSGLVSRIVRSVSKLLYRLATARTDRVWFTNKNDLAYFIDRGLLTAAKAVLTRNYLDTDEYAPGIVSSGEVVALRRELGLAPDDQVVIMVARLIWSKGIREFVESASFLRDRMPHLRFLLLAPVETGNADAVPESYVRAAERLGTFRWLGFRKDVKQLYELSSLAVLPSYYKEGGYPRALLEPMAMGKPVITTTSEDCRAAVDEGRNGWLVPIKDSAALAGAIERLMSNEETRVRFGEHSREKAVREFDERSIIRHALSQLGLAMGR
jgi:N,N'-diacetylbacillosaminyl-diphospho-undecaprenol alpha-1,3-N-acetylgalactosaminyltransferase